MIYDISLPAWVQIKIPPAIQRLAINDFTSECRAILDTAVFRIALRWSTLKYYFCIFLAINPLLTGR